MSEERPPYAVTPAPAAPDDTKVVYEWQRKLLRKANRLKASPQTVALTVIFHADGVVTFFQGEMDGRIMP